MNHSVPPPVPVPSPSPCHLIADIGGTNARFGLVDPDGTIREEWICKVADYADFDEALLAYLDGREITVQNAAVGVGAPVQDPDSVRLTNYTTWHISARLIRHLLKADHVAVLNDFHAVALSIPYFGAADFFHLAGGDKRDDSAPRLIVGPGTGLGVAGLIRTGDGYIALPGEGGHVTAPVQTPREYAVVRWLLDQKYSHVSAERLCSGKGLANIYKALCAVDGLADMPERTPEEISLAALAAPKPCETCAEALDLMLGFLGRVAGNAALNLAAFGGVYFAGGILPALGKAALKRSALYRGFVDKGRFESYLRPIPLYVLTHPRPAFLGLKAYVLAGNR